MIRFLLFLSALSAFAMLAARLADSQGMITADIAGWRIETSPLIALLALVFLFAAVLALLKALQWITETPEQIKMKRRLNAHQKGLSTITEAVAALAVSDLPNAKKLNTKAARILPNIPMTHLLSAQIATMEGNDEAAAEHLRPLKDYKETEFLATRGLMQQAKKAGDLQKALRLAEESRTLRPDSHFATLSLLDAYTQQQRWQDALEIVQKARRYRSLSRQEVMHFTAMIEYLHAKILSEQQTDDRLTKKYAAAAHKHEPSSVPFAVLLAELESRIGNPRAAFRALEESWAANPHPALATLTHRIFAGEDAMQRLKRIEKLTASQPHHVETHLALAEAALGAKSPVIAQSHIKEALKLRETKRACMLMVSWLTQEGKDAEQIQEWQTRAIRAHDDAEWACTSCRTKHTQWHAHCPSCHAFDSVEWKTSPVYFAGDETRKQIA